MSKPKSSPRQLPLPLPEPPPVIILECRVPDWKGRRSGRGRRPTRPRLFRVGDPQELHVRGPRALRHPGQRYQCASILLIEVEGRAPFWAARGVVPLPPEDPAAALTSPPEDPAAAAPAFPQPGNGPSPAQSARPPRRQRQRAA